MKTKYKKYLNQKGYVSLVKLFGQNIKDLTGYVAEIDGCHILTVQQLILENNETVWLNGCYDNAYVEIFPKDKKYDDIIENMYEEE